MDRPTCRDDAIIVFDSSGSMGSPAGEGLSRMDLARAAARQVVPLAARIRNLGLVIYGPGDKGRCQKHDLIVAPQANAAEKILNAIDTSKTDGETPLTAAVDAAAQALNYTKKPAVVVLLTDGDENCGRFPCQLAHELKSKAHKLTVHVIAFRLSSRSYRALSCLSRETGGQLLPANTMEQLISALSQTLTCPEVTQPAPGTMENTARSTSPSGPHPLFANRREGQPAQCLPP